MGSKNYSKRSRGFPERGEPPLEASQTKNLDCKNAHEKTKAPDVVSKNPKRFEALREHEGYSFSMDGNAVKRKIGKGMKSKIKATTFGKIDDLFLAKEILDYEIITEIMD